ncbi:MAG: N-acetylmuramoyl-L-alanine amidase [Phycisphaerales bacterium]
MRHLFILVAAFFLAVQTASSQNITATEIEVWAGERDAGPLRLAAGDSVTVELDAPFAYRSLGIWWSGTTIGDDAGAGAGAGFFVTPTVASGAEAPPRWRMVEAVDLAPDRAGPTGRAGRRRVSAVEHHYGDPARGARVELRGPIEVESLAVVWLRDSGPSAPEVVVADRARIDPANYPKPPVSSRAQWGADPPICGYSYCATTHIGVHHTAGASEYWSTSWGQCAANVRAIQDYHMYSRGWCDIGYNYLVCVHGDIWEGRGGGDDVRGAHDGYNCGSMGVSFMGYFHYPYNQTLNAAMIDAIAELGAWKCDQQGIDPHGSGWYQGYGGVMSNLYGHRNVSSTACPGDLAYSELGSIRDEIAQRLAGGGGEEIILDNDRATFTRDWSYGSTASGRFGPDYRFRSTGLSRGLAYWRPDIPQAGFYTVYFWWSQGTNRNPSATCGVRITGDTYTVRVNQQVNGGRWNAIGSWWFPRGTSSLVGIASDGPSGYVTIADAVRLVRN